MHVKALLNIKLTYFKESGKYYDSADFFRDFEEDCAQGYPCLLKMTGQSEFQQQ